MPRARVSYRKYISRRGNFSFYKPRSKELAQKKIFYFVGLGFKAEMFSLELHLTKFVKRYSIKLNSLGYDIYLRVIWVQFNKSF